MDDLDKLVEENFDAKTAAIENELRRKISHAFQRELACKKISPNILAKNIGISMSQCRRLLHQEVGGNLRLSTIVRAAWYFGLQPVLDISYIIDCSKYGF